MEQVDFFSAWQVTFKSNGPDKKERTQRNENVGILTNFLTTKSPLNLSNTEILCEEHVKL